MEEYAENFGKKFNVFGQKTNPSSKDLDLTPLEH